MTSSISEHLAEFATGLSFSNLPDTVRTHARMLTLDAIGCGIAGSVAGEAEILRRSIRAMSDGAGGSPIWGTSEVAPLPLAVMTNSVCVHTREIDDFSLAYHAGSVVIPAALGVATAIGASGNELLTAVVAGYETSFRIAQGGAEEGIPGFLPFKKKGWHSTSLFGPFGAAVAAAKLLKLNAEQTKWAIGVAGSCSSGTWAFAEEANICKRVHAGLASKSGVVAAYLAREGITGPSRYFEADWGGFYSTHLQGEKYYPQHVVDRLGSDWQILHAGFKPYASCRRVHSSLDAVFEIMKKHRLSASDVRRVTVNGNAIHQRQLSRFPVRTVLEAQFSLPYTLAAAVVAGGAGLDQYTEAAMNRPDVRALAERIQVKVDPNVSETGEPRLEVELKDGRVLTETVAVPKGHPKNPLSVDELIKKFRGNAGLVLPGKNVVALEEALLRLEDIVNVRTIVPMLCS